MRGQHKFRHGLLLIAVIAMAAALLLLLLSHGQTAGHAMPLFLLTAVFIGLLPSPVLMARVSYMRLGFAPSEPLLAVAFQRPPPFQLS